MAGFFKGLLRANSTIYGDLEGPMTGLKSGRLSLTVEGGKCIAWIVGAKDLELSKENVKTLEFVDHALIDDLCSGGGKKHCVSVYQIRMKDDSIGTLRLVTTGEKEVLDLLK